MALIDNIVSYWKQDEASGNAVDSHGGYTGVNTSATYVAGKIGNGSNSTGPTQYIEVSHEAGLYRTSGAHSISMWWRHVDTVSQAIYSVSKMDFDAGAREGFGFQFINGSGLRFNVQKNGTVQSTGLYNTGWVADTWRHVVATWDTAGLLATMYVDGASVATAVLTATTYTQNTLAFSFHSAFSTSRIGAGTGVGVDELGFWDRVLTAAEVTELYNGGAGLAYPFSSGPANLKSYNTNLKANIKSIDTNLIANVKSFDTNV